jgi:SAM-dependent methyltransferase
MNMEIDVPVLEEVLDLGPLGPTKLFQVPGSDFQIACLQRNSVNSDNTGYRVHAGAYVAIRFLEKMSALLEGKHVLELGTGSGVVGVVASRLAALASIALTDGNAKALDIATLNAQSISPDCKFDIFQLLWGPVLESFPRSLNSLDVIIGSELMYYKTDVSQLSETVAAILKPDGVFLHIHHFRVEGLDVNLVTTLESIGLRTLECRPGTFLSRGDEDEHPEWLQIKCLVSAHPEVADKLLAEYPFLLTYAPCLQDSDCDGDDDEDSDGEPEIKLSMQELFSKYDVVVEQ